MRRGSGGICAEPQKGQSWFPVGHVVRGPEGLVDGSLKGDEHSDTSVESVGKTYPKDFRVQGGARGGRMGNNCFSPEREGWVSGDRACRGGLEGLHSGDEFSSQEDYDATQRTQWVQGS